MSGALILTGAPGSGKSTVLEKLGTQLEVADIKFGAIESEWFGYGWPWLDGDGVLEQLATVVALQRKAGRDTFLVVATTETQRELQQVIDAVGANRTVVVCLSAPAELVAERVAAREPDDWPGKTQLVEHSRQLADQIPPIPGIDALISTVGRDPREIATEIRELLRARGILSRA